MAIYHCSIKNISRSSGRSAVASASYRAGEKLKDKETGLTHDYTKKSDVAYSEIFLCENAPNEYRDRETLWNEVEKVEKQCNARLAREWEVALPNELAFEQSKEIVRNFAQSLADEGMCIDVNIHWKDGNHHAHIMGTTRPIKSNGEWGQKEKKAYKLDENGNKIPQIDPKTGEQKIGARGRKMWQRETVEVNDWNRSEKVEEWRERWAEYCNYYLKKEHQIDHRSYERQGIERIPTIHEGYIARDMERKGQIAERCEINRDIKADNNKLSKLEHEQNSLVKQKATVKEENSREEQKEQLEKEQGQEVERTDSERNRRYEGDEIDEKIYNWLLDASKIGTEKVDKLPIELLKETLVKALQKSAELSKNVLQQTADLTTKGLKRVGKRFKNKSKNENRLIKMSMSHFQKLPNYETFREIIHTRFLKCEIAHKFFINKETNTEYLTYDIKDAAAVPKSWELLQEQVEKTAERAEEYLNRQREKEEPEIEEVNNVVERSETRPKAEMSQNRPKSLRERGESARNTSSAVNREQNNRSTRTHER